MKISNLPFGKFLVSVLLGGILAAPVIALEVVTEQDLVQGIIVKEQLVRVADNAILMLDTSSSMNEEFRDSGKSKIELVSNEFIKRAGYFPEIGHKFGVYTYTSWEEFSPVQLFDREKVSAALQAVPKKGSGPTPLKNGLVKLEDVLKPLSGRTVVFLFSDGEYTGGSPSKIAAKLASTYDVCFYVISTAKADANITLAEDVASLNACSRMIALETFLNRPEYTSGALFDVRATEEIVTTTETKITGLKVDNMNFAFDKFELSDHDKSELDELGQFMKGKPESIAVIAGYTDNVGTEDYNEGLSRRRTEMVSGYMTDAHDIGSDRVVLQWYGSDNPMASNNTAEGRATNRRVEVAIGGL
jgi:OOP family OmpA-OmpF porin